MYDLIAISGKQFAGKDRFADLLLQELPDFRKVPLARAIKVEFANLYGLTPDEIEENKATYRSGLIALGQRRRQQNPDYWIQQVLNVPGRKIVPDIRMRREYEFFKAQPHAFLLRIEADREIRAQRGQLVQESDPTECELDEVKDWDAVVINNGSVDELRQQAREIARSILSKAGSV